MTDAALLGEGEGPIRRYSDVGKAGHGHAMARDVVPVVLGRHAQLLDSRPGLGRRNHVTFDAQECVITERSMQGHAGHGFDVIG